MKKILFFFFAFLALGIGIAIFAPANNADAALQCQNGTTTTYQQSWYGCFGETDASSCGGFCSSGWCYEPAATPTYETCPADSSSCSYASACSQTGTQTNTFYICGSPTTGCVRQTSTEFGGCSRNTNGQSCGTNLACSNGSCVSTCVSNIGQSCNINACGTAGGTVQCNGSCSGSTPATPYTVGASCNRNACGGTGTVTDQCTGACSASAPTLYSGACKSLANNLGETNSGSITNQCTGACSATAPADASISIVASPATATVNNGANVAYTATSTRDVGPTNYYIRIYESSTQRASCNKGTTCQYSTSDNNVTRTFVGKIETGAGGSVAATSNLVSTAWSKITTQLPDVNFSFNPAAITQGKSTTVQGWLTTSSGTGIGGKTIDLQCWNGNVGIEAWVYVAAGATETVAPDTGYTSFSWTPASSWKGDVSCRLNFAGDVNYLSSTSGQKTITVNPAQKCAAPQNLSCPTYNPITNILTLSWSPVNSVTSYLMEWARFDKSYGDTTGTFGGISRIVSGTSGDTSQLSMNTTFKLHARPETSLSSACSVPGAFSADIECYTGTCQKTSTPKTDSSWVPVPTAQGVKQCAITITHSGADLTDNSSVSYETKSSGVTSRTIAMDDNPTTGCNDNLVFQTSWPLTARVQSVAQSKSASHDLSFGYTVNTAGSGCVIKNATSNSSCASGNTSGENACSLPTISADQRTATKKHGISQNYSSAASTGYGGVHSDFSFNFVECTANAQCTPGSSSANSDANANKQICNIGITNNFPQNTCVDSVRPSSTINEKSAASGFQPGPDGIKGTADDIPWFKAGTYFIPVTDTDSGSGIDPNSCWYSLRDFPTGRLKDTTFRTYGTCGTTDSTIVVKVGPEIDPVTHAVTDNNCVSQGLERCEITVFASDKAGNTIFRTQTLNIDYTPPTAR